MGQNLYERLLKEHRPYTFGKKPSILKGACRYIEGLQGHEEYRTQAQIAKKFGCTAPILWLRIQEIMALFGEVVDLRKELTSKLLRQKF